MSACNGTLRPKRPQLNDSIEKLDEMIDGLAVAIPGAVADSLREALGAGFAAAIKDAVTAAVAEALKGFAPAVATQPVPAPVPPVPPAPPVKPAVSAWTKVKAALGRLRRWSVRVAAPVLTPVFAHAVLAWAVAKVIGAATVPGHFNEHDLSSGMRRTLMHFARLALWPDGTLILVDEFENSLGANCIDAVAQQLLGSRRRLQFIITSHHPYIINAIPKGRWKIIARDKGRIKNFAPDELGLDDSSRHESFLQLINTEVFKFGTLPDESLLLG